MSKKGEGGFRWTPENETAARDFLTSALWRPNGGGRSGGKRNADEALSLSESDKARIAGIVDTLDRFVRADLSIRRSKQKHLSTDANLLGRRGGSVMKGKKKRKGGGCEQVPTASGPRWLCDSPPCPSQANYGSFARQVPGALATALLPAAAYQIGSGLYSGAQGLYNWALPGTAVAQAPIPPGWAAQVGAFGSQAASQLGSLGSQLGSLGYNAAGQLGSLGYNAAGQLGALGKSALEYAGLVDPPPWWQRALNTVSSFAASAYEALKSGISAVWGALGAVVGSAASLIASAPGWVFVLPIAAAGLYMYYLRYAQRAEAAKEREAGNLLAKVIANTNEINQLGQLITMNPEFQGVAELQQTVLPAFVRYLQQLANFEVILRATNSTSEPLNAVQMLAELLTIQTNIEATRQKIRTLVSPQSLAIAQAQRPQPFVQQQQPQTFQQPQMFQQQPQMFQQQPQTFQQTQMFQPQMFQPPQTPQYAQPQLYPQPFVQGALSPQPFLQGQTQPQPFLQGPAAPQFNSGFYPPPGMGFG